MQHRKKLMSGKTVEQKQAEGKILISMDDVVEEEPILEPIQQEEAPEDFESDIDLL